jgi:hypothetical protein
MHTPIDLRLARHGVILLLLGLLTGFAIPRFHNPHFGNAAHLVGLIGGFGLIAFGLLWPRLDLGRLWSGVGAWFAASGMYLSWLGLVLGGAFGSGLSARAGQIALVLGAWLALFATIIVLAGLRKLAAPDAAGAALITATTKS